MLEGELSAAQQAAKQAPSRSLKGLVERLRGQLALKEKQQRVGKGREFRGRGWEFKYWRENSDSYIIVVHVGCSIVEKVLRVINVFDKLHVHVRLATNKKLVPLAPPPTGPESGIAPGEG